MTIAVCYVSPEGVVFGADSTSTYSTADGNHYFNHGQKLFEVGENSTLGIATWGLGGLGVISYRRLVADLADDLKANVPTSVLDAASRWAARFWPLYNAAPFQPQRQRCRVLDGKTVFDAAAAASPAMRTKDEEEEYLKLKQGLLVGFCLGGYTPPDRSPAAYQIIFDPMLLAAPVPVPVPMGTQMFWGAPNMLRRLLHGNDEKISGEIIKSGHWNGTQQQLEAILSKYQLNHPIVPIRDAIDFTYYCIYSTIKAFKFSNLSQICGGSIEIAVVTTDRNFRWVRHKELHSAITEDRL